MNGFFNQINEASRSFMEQNSNMLPGLFRRNRQEHPATNRAQEASFQQPQPSRIPPASLAAIRRLPTITVTPEDLVDPTNRECCICFEEHNIRDRVVRLPCAHIYHANCITDWLRRHCTCPTCRYELRTDDPNYERGRRERMKMRKPRYARYELERMSIRELKGLLGNKKSRAPPFSDKRDVIDYLLQSGAVDEIAAPLPVEHPNKAALRAMGVAKLRRTLNDAGVFFDPIDVVEKEDMVTIFVNSGRVVFSQPDVDMEDEPLGDPETTEETKTQPDEGEGLTTSLRQVPVVETVIECTSGDELSAGGLKQREWTSSFVMEEEDDLESNDVNMGIPGEEELEQDHNVVDIEDNTTSAALDSENHDEEMIQDAPVQLNASNTVVEPQQGNHANDTDRNNVTPSRDRREQRRTGSLALAQAAESIQDRSVSEIRAFAEAVDVDISNCSDREDMVETLLNAAEMRPHLASYLVALAPLAGQSVAQLRAIARLRSVGVSDCLEKGEIIHRLATSMSQQGR